MTNDEILDITRLRDAFGDDDAGIAEFLGMARETERTYITALSDAFNIDDIAAVAKAAHSIKGSASNIGATRLSTAASVIEDQARAGRRDGLDAAVLELRAAYEQLCARIDEWTEAAR